MIDSGIYILEIKLNNDQSIKVGALGNISFKKGKYYYIGSAQKNLLSRIDRHLKKEKKFHWHIDYLLDKAKIIQYFLFEKEKYFECKLTQEIIKSKNLKVSVIGFGSSDCSCDSHLLYTSKEIDFNKYIKLYNYNYENNLISRSE